MTTRPRTAAPAPAWAETSRRLLARPHRAAPLRRSCAASDPTPVTATTPASSVGSSTWGRRPRTQQDVRSPATMRLARIAGIADNAMTGRDLIPVKFAVGNWPFMATPLRPRVLTSLGTWAGDLAVHPCRRQDHHNAGDQGSHRAVPVPFSLGTRSGHEDTRLPRQPLAYANPYVNSSAHRRPTPVSHDLCDRPTCRQDSEGAGFHGAQTTMATFARIHSAATASIEPLTSRDRRRATAATSSALLPSGRGQSRHRPVPTQTAARPKPIQTVQFPDATLSWYASTCGLLSSARWGSLARRRNNTSPWALWPSSGQEPIRTAAVRSRPFAKKPGWGRSVARCRRSITVLQASRASSYAAFSAVMTGPRNAVRAPCPLPRREVHGADPDYVPDAPPDWA